MSLFPAISVILAAGTILVLGAGCSLAAADSAATHPYSHSAAKPLLVEADFDGDERGEFASLGSGPGGVVIVDGDSIYRSRGKWSVAQAAVADLDGSGLPEVVALLDSGEKRRLGLIGWHGGAYRERLVSRPLAPRPDGFRLIRLDGSAPRPMETQWADAIEFFYKDAPSARFRWNGFGFVHVE
jgi:hypothetical protein